MDAKVCLDTDASIEIFKDLKKRGKLIPMRDLFIASSSIVNNCALATLNKKHFENIKGLELLNF